MAASALADKSAPIPRRPWLRNTALLLLRRKTVIHADLYAWCALDDVLYFELRYALGGTELIAVDWYMLGDGQLAARAPDNMGAGLIPLYWSRDNNSTFGPVHAALIARARGATYPECTRVSLHCHYVRTIDATPWPRGWQNMKGRARVDRMAMDRAALSGDRIVLPDWL